MTAKALRGNSPISETGARVNAPAEWRSALTGAIGALLLFESVTGLAIYLLPFSRFNQLSVILHTLAGLAMLAPAAWYLGRHWRVRRKGNLSHYQLLGYVSVALLATCTASGLVLTYHGAVGPRISYAWDLVHLVTGVAMIVFLLVHLATVVVRKVKNPESLAALRGARRVFYRRSVVGCGLLLGGCGLWSLMYSQPRTNQAFPEDYSWRFGEDRPFAPSLARVDHSGWADRVQQQVLGALPPSSRATYLAAFEKRAGGSGGLFARIERGLGDLELGVDERREVAGILADATGYLKRHGAIDAGALAGSAGCGTSGCHGEIYREWLPSAHRYSALDDMFQRVQALMAVETSPQHTRYCAGCHDPISLFSGAKTPGNITLSAEGADEGSSCLVCHSIVQTDVQGNADYTIRLPRRYVYERDEGRLAKFVSDFLIRTYPEHHINSYSRPLYKTSEFCAACHKQYIDKEVNTDIGKVQGQNQYDSWKNSRWYHEGDPSRTIGCRECHMPLAESRDPARGDPTDYNRSARDRKHRSHRMLASNQYIPILHDLPGGRQHARLVEEWLRGRIDIPEIADKWTTGPTVRMEITAPETVSPGQQVSVQVILINNKTGHDFPTGPLDMIESWVELKVADAAGRLLHHTGGLDASGRIVDSQVLYRAEGFDRAGGPIDRHNLWDLVGASYKRTLFPGATDAVEVQFQCPSMARGRVRSASDRLPPGQRMEAFGFDAPRETEPGELTVTAVLWYRKANPEFLDRVYGAEAGVRAPITEMTRATATIKVVSHAQAPAQ